MPCGIVGPISTDFIKASGHLFNPFAKIIASKGVCVANGALGANLFECGSETDYHLELWPSEWLDDIFWSQHSLIDD